MNSNKNQDFEKKNIDAALTDSASKAVKRPEYVAIGKIIKPHGIAGEFKVTPFSQNVEHRFRKLQSFYLIRNDGDTPVLHTVTSVKITPRYVILGSDKIKLEDLDRLRDCYIYIKSEELEELSDGNFYSFELINMRAVDTNGNELGFVSDILEGIGNDIIELTVTASGQKAMIPFVKAFINNVDVAGKTITINVMEGLL